jgi:hypothetical protein
MISSNKLYEAELDIAEPEEASSEDAGKRRKAVVHRDVVSWYNTFSAQNEKATANSQNGGRKRISGTNPGLIKESIFSDQAAEMPIENLLSFNEEAKSMFE